MIPRIAVVALAVLLAVPAIGRAALFIEDFDSYANGTSLHGVNGWEGWYGSSSATAYVSNAQSASSPNSVDISGSSDLVHTFAGVTDGQWHVTAKQYVPSGTTGGTFFILMNTYPYLGSDSWSVQLYADLTADTVTDFSNPSNTIPLVRDQWVDIQVDIDLDANQFSAYYNNQLVLSDAWYGDTQALQALDLYSENTGPVYYDDIRVFIPEPSTLAMLLGLAAVGLLSWMRRRGR